ncbi:hypothetical protein DPMN_052483 [Dreissena polymorpha]|uniref:Uncharacterized protein n=1 Tax=Dreissena polymorpha TaxID=45954 RepID=A0A9D4CKZ6_DREPO|nr:hypothetical protein DPMN_052483 [Dreissena polymorpha]
MLDVPFLQMLSDSYLSLKCPLSATVRPDLTCPRSGKSTNSCPKGDNQNVKQREIMKIV